MSHSQSAVLMDQYAVPGVPDDKDLLSSGLAHVGLTTEPLRLGETVSGTVPAKGSKKIVPAAGSVSLLEKPVMGLLMLRAAQDAEALSQALSEQCGLSLSERLQSESKGDCCIRWMSPDAWLLSCPLQDTYAIEKALRQAVSGHIAIINVSGGYSVLELTGANARRVLMKSTSYDVHPDHFTQGKVVNTVFAKAQVTLRAIEPSETHANDTRANSQSDNAQARYELIVRRSFSDYIWLWIQRAAMVHGFAAYRE